MPDISDGATVTYIRMREVAYMREYYTFTYAQLREIRNKSRKTITRHLDELHEANLMMVDRQQGRDTVAIKFIDPSADHQPRSTSDTDVRSSSTSDIDVRSTSDTGVRSGPSTSDTHVRSEHATPLKSFKLRKGKRLESHGASLSEQDSESNVTDTTTADYIAIHDTAEHILPKWNERQVHKLTTAIVDAIEDKNTGLTRAEAVHIIRTEENAPDIGNRKNPEGYIQYLLACRGRIARNRLQLTRAHPIISPSRFQALHAMISNARWTDEEKVELYSHIAWFLILEDLDEEPALEILKIRACENYGSLDGYLSFWDKDLEGEARYGWVKELIVEGV